MVEVRFYHLQKQSLDQVLPLILEKVLQADKRAVVRLSNTGEVTRMNDILWTYKPNSFLPHGAAKNAKENMSAEAQPIWLTHQSENPNAADTLILTQGVTEDDLDTYDLVCEMLDGRDDTAITAARTRWKTYKEKAYDVTYWFQSESGKWEKKA